MVHYQLRKTVSLLVQEEKPALQGGVRNGSDASEISDIEDLELGLESFFGISATSLKQLRAFEMCCQLTVGSS